MNYCTVMQAFVALPIGAESRFQPGRKKPTLDEAAWRSFVEEVLGWVAESARACEYYVTFTKFAGTEKMFLSAVNLLTSEFWL